jgi:hypothetical protein
MSWPRSSVPGERTMGSAILRGAASSWMVLALSLVMPSCERAPAVATVDAPVDAALAPVVLAPSTEPRGITHFDCVGTHKDHASLSLRGWGSAGPAGAALGLKGSDLSCELSLRGDCSGQAELRISTGLARSEKVVTAVSPERAVSVQLRLLSGAWERAIEPSEGTPYGHVLQISARAQVRCAAPVSDPRPRYFTDSFVVGLAGGERPRAQEQAEEAEEEAVEEIDQTAPGENAEAQRAADPRRSAESPVGAEAKGTPKPEASAAAKPAAESEGAVSDAQAARARRAARKARKQQQAQTQAEQSVEPAPE